MTGAMINGFSLKSVRTMETPEGLAVKANLFLNGRKLGEYWDAGGGTPYRFTPVAGISEERILMALRDFPPASDGESGFSVPWDIGILVDRIIRQNRLFRSYRKAASRNGYLVEADSEKRGRSVCYSIKNNTPDETAEKLIRQDLVRNYSSDEDFEIRVYHSEEDFIISDTEVNL